MLGEILLGIAMVSDCADFVRKASGESVRSEVAMAISPSHRVSSHELSSAFRMPSMLDGLVAILFQGKNLRVYGVTNRDRSAFEKIEVWGFERFPRPLLSVNAEGVVTKFAEDSVLVTALVEMPRFEKILIEKKILPQFENQQKWKLKVQTYEALDSEIANAEHIPSWREIYRTLLENRLALEIGSKQKKAISIFQNPAVDNGVRHIEFGGWLPEQQSAAVVIQQRRISNGMALKVFVHPNFKSYFDPAFPDLSQRISIEQRFELEWLRLNKLTVIETEAEIVREGDSEKGIPPVLSDNFIMAFEEGQRLPPQTPFFRLDSATGERIGGRQVLARELKP